MFHDSDNEAHSPTLSEYEALSDADLQTEDDECEINWEDLPGTYA